MTLNPRAHKLGQKVKIDILKNICIFSSSGCRAEKLSIYLNKTRMGQPHFKNLMIPAGVVVLGRGHNSKINIITFILYLLAPLL